jgi:hypothetical protein
MEGSPPAIIYGRYHTNISARAAIPKDEGLHLIDDARFGRHFMCLCFIDTFHKRFIAQVSHSLKFLFGYRRGLFLVHTLVDQEADRDLLRRRTSSGSTSPIGTRNTADALSSNGVGSALMMTSLAPASSAICGSRATG